MFDVIPRAIVCRVIAAFVVVAVFMSAGKSEQEGKTSTPQRGITAVGSLYVKLKPNEVKYAGALWRVDGGPWQESGSIVNNLEVGVHEISFKRTLSWKRPRPKTVVISEGQRTFVAARYEPKSSFNIELPKGVTLEMVRVPSGSFQMGRYLNEEGSLESEDPQHTVTFAKGFWIGKYEVTKAQWEAVMDTSPWEGRNQIITDPDSPAVFVSWDDVHVFIATLNAHILRTRQGVSGCRLPSEAKWEYACRANTTTRFYWGDDLDFEDIDNYAWWGGNAWEEDERYAHVVGQKTPNDWGLCDMSGNVWEWCEDEYHENYVGAPTNGSAWETSIEPLTYVIRGGSWTGGSGTFCRSAYRGSNIPSGKNSSLGFRVAI